MSAQPHPGAFTREQLWRGALHSWIAFMVLMVLAWTIAAIVSDVTSDLHSSTGAVAILPIILVYAILIGGAVSLIVTLVGVPLAALVGRGLRDVRSRAIHVLVFAGFGALVGAIPPVILAVDGRGYLVEFLAVVSITICAASTAYGRWRADRPPRRRADRDARDEDAIVDLGL